MTDRHALVTGACGFIGQRLCRRLLDEGYAVRATDLSSADSDGLPDEAAFVSADLTEPATLDDAVADVDVVFHTAALFSYSSLLDWAQFEAVNVDGTRNLCDAASDAGVDRIVNWSTCGVYGDTDSDKLPVDEDHPTSPGSHYDRSKLQQEEVAHAHGEEAELDVVSMRCASVYGPGNTYGAAQMLLGIASGLVPAYPRYCDDRAGLVHVEDVVRAAVHLADEGEPDTVYNVADRCDYTMNRVIRDVAAATDNRVVGLPVGCGALERLIALRPLIARLEPLFDAVGREPPLEADALNYLRGNYWIDTSRIRATGWEPSYPRLRDGLDETLDWYEAQGML